MKISNSIFPPGALVAAYLRDSGGDSQDLSVPQQQAAFLAWCAKHALIPGQIFTDLARPGSNTVDRQGFLDMMYHFRTGAPEAGLVIWSYSRFARDIDDAQFYRADLRRRGYILYSINDEIPEGSIGRFFEAAIDWKNEQFLEDLSRDVKRGLRHLVETYGAVPGTPPRGFLRQPIQIAPRRDGHPRIVHRWIPDPEYIPRIRQAFEMRAQGATLLQISQATALYKSLNSYTTFFSNRLYTGVLEYGGITIDNYCEQLIDTATFNAVQQIAKEQATHLNLKSPGATRHPRRLNSRYLLTGLVYCARCGSPLYGSTSTPKSKTRTDRYSCTRAHRRHDCDLKPIPRPTLENAVIATLQEYILQPEALIAHQQLLDQDRQARAAQIRDQLIDLRRRLAAVRRRANHITEAIAESGHTRLLLEKLSQVESEETVILSQISAQERLYNAPPPELTTEELINMAQILRKTLTSADHTALLQILRGLVNRINIDREGTHIHGEIIYFHPP